MTLRIGVDVGGTFTDVFLFKDGDIYRGKSDTTHYDLKVGFMNAARTATEQAGLQLEDAVKTTDAIVYSTTVGTNALIERRGTRLGLITTKGFEDVVQVGRSRNWADGLSHDKKYDRGRARRPEPIIPKNRIVGIQERIDSLGRVVIPMRDRDVLDKIQMLVDQGVRGFVVCLLNSFVDSSHEQRIRELIRERYPESYLGHMPVYLSSDISPKSGEYRRSMTVILDAYLREISSEHLLRLTDELRDFGYKQPFFVAKNTGGLSSLSRSQALELLGSSPAASVVGAEFLAKQLGLSNVVIGDMGGTSFDVGLIVADRDRVYESDPIVNRFRVQLPFVAHWSIGAGGGSMAQVVDSELKVGPQSVGSNPGPACYGRGGEYPSVTDANVVLGFLNPDNFLGGSIRLDAGRAENAIVKHVADPLGVSVWEAAWQIKLLIDGKMGQEMYRICAQISGEDPRSFTAFSLGGAGPLHATGFADFADIKSIATFSFSSVFGAFSTLTFDILQSYEKTVYMTMMTSGNAEYPLESIDIFNKTAKDLIALAERDMAEEGFDLTAIDLQIEIHMSYGQQRQTVEIRPSKTQISSASDLKQLCDDFNDEYGRRYGVGATYPEAGVEVVLMKLNAVGPIDEFKFRDNRETPTSGDPLVGTRRAYWGPEHGFMETPIYQYDLVGRNKELQGPAICEASDTTIVVSPGWKFHRDDKDVGWITKISGGEDG